MKLLITLLLNVVANICFETKVGLRVKSVMAGPFIQMKIMEQYLPVILFIMLYMRF